MLASFALGCGWILPVGAFASDETTASEGQLEEVVITAQKRSENLQSVPIAVTAVSAEQLASAGVVDTMALPSVVSGLSVGAAVGNFSPHIRGIGTTAYGIGIESPVALYVDGVYYGSQVTGMSDLVDVSQVNVLKGPQGTLFGRNATGGVIQLSTRDPDSVFGGDVRTELDNYLTSRSNFYVTDGLSDALKANLSVSYATQGHGWGTNIVDGDDIHKIDRDFSARSKVFFTPSSDTLIKLNFDYADQANSLFGNFGPAPGTHGHAPGYEPSSNPYDTDNSLDPANALQSGGASLDIDQNLGFAHLVSISAFRRYAWDTQFDPSLTPTPELLQFIQFQGNQFSQEFQLVSKQSEVFNWVTGLYYFHASDHEELQQYTFDVAAAPFAAGQIFELASGTTRSEAAFAQGTLLVLPATHLTLGLRYTTERRSIDGGITGGFYNLDGTGFNVPISGLTLDSGKSFNKLTDRLALDHNFTPDILGYLSYNRGFKSGGFNGFNPSSLNPAYNPEVVDAYEAGLKTESLDHRLRLNTALFYNKYNDIQIINFISIPSISNAARAQTYGVDLDAEALVTNFLRLTAGFEYLNSRFTGDSTGTVTAFVPGSGGDTVSMLGSVRGNQLPFAPEFTGNIGATYTQSYQWGTLDLNVTNAYTARQFYSEDNFLPQKAYDYLNTSLGWTSTDGHLSATLWGRNLLNKAVAGFLTSGALGYSADYSNPPRTYGFTLIYRFGG
jgi:outer membrane receptor protein involved in Fe transport